MRAGHEVAPKIETRGNHGGLELRGIHAIKNDFLDFLHGRFTVVVLKMRILLHPCEVE